MPLQGHEWGTGICLDGRNPDQFDWYVTNEKQIVLKKGSLPGISLYLQDHGAVPPILGAEVEAERHQPAITGDYGISQTQEQPSLDFTEQRQQDTRDPFQLSIKIKKTNL